ncbi:MAG: carboxymuconolactone decarboxylase family protein [Salinirussus sp.]
MARVPSRDKDDLDPEFHEYLVSSLQPGKPVNVYAAVGNNPAVLRGLRQFLGSLWTDSGLTDREREIVILTAATELRNEYEWHQHCNIAPDAGLTADEVAAIARDDHSHFTQPERALIAYARAVVRGRVTEPLHAAVDEHYDHETLAGAAATAAGYACLGLLIDAFGVEIEADDEFVGWDLSGRQD